MNMEANMRYIMMMPQKITIVMYHLLDPWGRLPRARTKQASNVDKYIHSKTTARIVPTVPNKSDSPSEVVKIRKTRKKLPYES